MTKQHENPYRKGTFMSQALLESQFTLKVTIEYVMAYDELVEESSSYITHSTVEVAKAATLLELYFIEEKLYAERCLPKEIQDCDFFCGDAKVVRAEVFDLFGKSVLMKFEDNWIKPVTSSHEIEAIEGLILELKSKARYERGMCDNFHTAKCLESRAEKLQFALVDSIVTRTELYQNEINTIFGQ